MVSFKNSFTYFPQMDEGLPHGKSPVSIFVILKYSSSTAEGGQNLAKKFGLLYLLTCKNVVVVLTLLKYCKTIG